MDKRIETLEKRMKDRGYLVTANFFPSKIYHIITVSKINILANNSPKRPTVSFESDVRVNIPKDTSKMSAEDFQEIEEKIVSHIEASPEL